MNKIVWDDALSVGVAELDGHHRRLAELINSLVDHGEDLSDKHLINNTISTLTAYAFYHFGREEQLMARSAYPQLESHLAEHERFCETMKEISRNAHMGLTDLKRLTDFLVAWWSHHIREVDVQYKPFLADKAASAATAPSEDRGAA